MKSEAYNSLFGSNVGQLHFNANIHDKSISRILAYLVFNSAEDFTNISEQDIQTEIDKLMRYKFNNTAFSGITEPNAFAQKRLDYKIQCGPTGEDLVFYEFKTVFKVTENSITERMVFPDLIKLAIKKHENPDCKAFFLLAGKQKVYKNALSSKNLRLPDKYSDPYSKEKVILLLDDLKSILNTNTFTDHLTQLTSKGIRGISISPSVWKHLEGISVLSFKLNNPVKY